MKYRAVDHEEVERRLLAIGAQPAPEMAQEDTYLRHPSRDFAQTNEALRIRRIGQENRVTYKGPKLAGPTKTREEIELGFEEGGASYEQLLCLFAHLGFQPVAVVQKHRRPYHVSLHGRSVEIALDKADELGVFVEVETLAASEQDLKTAQGLVLEVAQELGLTDVEPRSYLRMLLERQAAREHS